MSFADDLISILGMDVKRNEVSSVVNRHALNDSYNDPPFRYYLGASEKGIDLLFDNDRLLDIQIFVQKSSSHKAFADALPFGIQANMDDKDIHALLGVPEKHDSRSSRYTVLDGMATLTVVYDKRRAVSYLSIKADNL